MALDAFQAEVAAIALGVAAAHGFALAGANALVAHGIVDRKTKDVDLFSNEPGAPGAVAAAVQSALTEAGYDAEVTRAPEHNMGEFARLIIRRGEEAMELDLARDWRRWPPVNLQVGPVLHIDDAVSSKVTALVGRQAPRDFIDIAAALDHGYRRADLMRLAFDRDPGLRVEDFIQAARRLDHLDLDDFADYDFDAQAVDDLRLHFADWPRHEQDDTEGQAIRAEANANGPAHPNG